MSRIMRVIVFFDLPTGTTSEKKAYIEFRKFLLKSGYDMLQYSVYSRIANNRDQSEKLITKIKLHLPTRGQIRALNITEKQYESMKILLGKQTISEKEVKDKEILIL